MSKSENSTTGRKELKLKKVCGETTILESSWKTIQSLGTIQTVTSRWDLVTIASISSHKTLSGLSGNVGDRLEVALVVMILL